jgi:hypothetical protein
MGLRLSDLDAKTAARIQAQIDARAPVKTPVTTYHFVGGLKSIHLSSQDPVALAVKMDKWRAMYPLLPFHVYQVQEML